MALTKVIGDGVQGISNSSDATAITISSGEVLTLAQKLPTTNLGTGAVIQAKFATATGIRINNQSSTQHSGLTVTLTPTSTSNKLIISYSSTLYISGAAQLWNSIYVNDSEDTELQHQVYQAAGEHRYDIGGYFLLTPANTNSTTYKYYISRGSGSYTLGAATTQHNLLVQEIVL